MMIQNSEAEWGTQALKENYLRKPLEAPRKKKNEVSSLFRKFE
jgi:hypothetical protein